MKEPSITYYALDLEKRELERTLTELATSDVGAEIAGKVETKGLCATYDDGLKFINEGGLRQTLPSGGVPNYAIPSSSDDTSSPESSTSSTADSDSPEVTPASTPGDQHSPIHILFLGSSLGNFTRDDDVPFLKSLPLRPGSGDTLLLGLDHDNESGKIELAYNDPQGYTKDFIMNGLKSAGRFLGDENLFDAEKWEYVSRYNEEKGTQVFVPSSIPLLRLFCAARHEAFYRSRVDQTITDPKTQTEFSFLGNELIQVEVSHKVVISSCWFWCCPKISFSTRTRLPMPSSLDPTFDRSTGGQTAHPSTPCGSSNALSSCSRSSPLRAPHPKGSLFPLLSGCPLSRSGRICGLRGISLIVA